MIFFKKLFYLITGRYSYSHLSSKKEYYNSRLINHELRKVSEIDHKLITTYPRFTIYELKSEGNTKELIFDTSDSYWINYNFNIFELWNGQSLITDRKFKFKNKIFIIKDIQIDFLSDFDDYSIPSPFGHYHSEAYIGRDVPYNIQIIIKVKKELPDHSDISLQ